MRHCQHGGIDFRAGLQLWQFPVKRGHARILFAEEGFKFAFELFVAAHWANFSRIFANA